MGIICSVGRWWGYNIDRCINATHAAWSHPTITTNFVLITIRLYWWSTYPYITRKCHPEIIVREDANSPLLLPKVLVSWSYHQVDKYQTQESERENKHQFQRRKATPTPHFCGESLTFQWISSQLEIPGHKLHCNWTPDHRTVTREVCIFSGHVCGVLGLRLFSGHVCGVLGLRLMCNL